MGGYLAEARAERTSYENIETTCPNCASNCVLNRISDLKTRMPVAGKEVPCPECGRPFWLLGDTLNAGYEAMVHDAAHLLRRNDYMLSVVRACQAYEMLFALYLRVELVYRPFARSSRRRELVSPTLFQTKRAQDHPHPAEQHRQTRCRRK